MVNRRIKNHEVGEIDTRAPFQSVKAAVSLFREVAVSREKPAVKKSKLSSENVLAKETQLLLAQRELSKIKQQLGSSETTKARALAELEKAKRTLQDLTTKLKTVSESKQLVIEAAESVKNQAKKIEAEKSRNVAGCEDWKEEVEHARKMYMATVTKLDAAKQELTKIRQDFDAALEAKLAAFQQAAEAQRSANINTEKVCELSKEIAAMQSSTEHLKLATLQAQQEQGKMVAEKDACLQSYKSKKEEAEKKLLSMKEEVDLESTRNLEVMFAETSAEIEVLQEEMKKAHAYGMDTVRVVTSKLAEATKTLQEVAKEESSLRSSVSSLRLELEDVKKEQEVEEKELLSKAEEMKRTANELKQEAEATRIASEEAEKKLELVLKEAEEAKAAEQRALSEMKNFSEKQDGRLSSNSQQGAYIKLTVEEFESLNRKIKEYQNLAENKEEAAMAHLEAIDAITSQADRKLEANLKAIEEIKVATELALKKADMADSARTVVEGELRRWRQEQKGGSDAASTIIEH
ncbi:hypothetical protein FH972_000026 [Carpinus fangiana]|uniref:WEB family protein n=1 Tax=Carpinus fangiana TaxID=176857 RepID=A0A5N6Q9V6_9ROSI|nr:hypothetical protein FH972_000026 [Carpinus fangiana]